MDKAKKRGIAWVNTPEPGGDLWPMLRCGRGESDYGGSAPHKERRVVKRDDESEKETNNDDTTATTTITTAIESIRNKLANLNINDDNRKNAASTHRLHANKFEQSGDNEGGVSVKEQQPHPRQQQAQQPQPQEQQASASQLLPTSTSMIFTGCVFVFDENFAPRKKALLIKAIKGHGGKAAYSVTNIATHFVMKENAEKPSKKLAAAQRFAVHIVSPEFISESVSSGERKSEGDYEIVPSSAPLPLPNGSSSTQ